MVPMRGWKTVGTSHEPSRLRVADPRSGPRLCEAQRFMVPMRAQKRKDAFQEPPLRPPPRNQEEESRTRTRTRTIGFMAPMRDSGIVEAPHEPGRTSNIEHPTPNIESQRESSLTSAFGVRCWMFDVFRRFKGFKA